MKDKESLFFTITFILVVIVITGMMFAIGGVR